MKKTLLLFCFLAMTLIAKAVDFKYDGVTYTVISEVDKTVSTKAGTSSTPGHSGLTGELKLHEEVPHNGDTYTLTEIGDYSFYDCSELTGTLTIPESVTKIGNFSFRNCNGFNGTLTFGNSVTHIGSGAFYDCSGFTGSLVLPDNLIELGSNAFTGCSGFTGSLNLPEGLTTINIGTFYGCKGFNGTLKLPAKLTAINFSAFRGCSGFTGTLDLPEGLTEIPLLTFAGCKGFTGSLTIPNSVTTIGRNAFDGCSGFNELSLPESLISIGSAAFYSCSGFTGSLTIPESVTTIGSEAFRNCNGFTGSLSIPKQITFIDIFTFQDCSGFNGTLTIPESVTSISTNAFAGCSGFTGTLKIPNFVTTIGDGAFSSCKGFTGSLTIPNSVTSIGKQAFYNCTGFNGTLTLENSLTTIGDQAFYGCSGFTGALTIGKAVTTIGENAFYNCSGLKGVYITDLKAWCNIDFSNIYSNPLYYAKNLYLNNEAITDLIIPEEITEIKPYTFISAENMTGSLTIGNSVTAIGNRAFHSCSGLTGSLTLGNSVTSIEELAFYSCSGLNGALVIPNSVTEIGQGAFERCSGFSSVTIGENLEKMGDDRYGDVFVTCDKLESVTCLAKIPPVTQYNNFSNYNIPLYVPAGTEEAYRTATDWKKFTNIESFEIEEPVSWYEEGDDEAVVKERLYMIPEEVKDLSEFTEGLAVTSWVSANDNVVGVSDNGIITADKFGETMIRAKDAEGVTLAVFHVFVCPTITIEHGSGAIYSHQVVYNSKPTIVVAAGNGYRIAGATHGDDDIYDEIMANNGKYVPTEPITGNSVINLALEELENGPTTDAGAVFNDPNIRILVNGHTVNIVGVDNNTVVRMYNIAGAKLFDHVNYPNIEVIDAGVYIIEIDGQPNTYKIVVR